MDPKYSVTICNQSGVTQTYVVFSGPPTINPAPHLVQTNVMFVLREVAGDGGQAYFTMPSTSLFAICGTFDGRSKHDSLQFEVLDSVPVKLGTRADDGTLIYGTTCAMVVPHSSPMFSETSPTTPSGGLGSFCVRTKKDFTAKQAVAGEQSFRIFFEKGPAHQDM
ncbi:uncharacterized protein N7479_000697 [Penicillium vulpinum]|uniref:uncharacterized protein n=1 Tax=Penicillium vulpinum TaxID=29845 RepID=UPI002549363A|nr:uncharacterized protein N7479_000697 [Penicillium vulpinum]KAJ5970779.1 hypothetical protein N7479_000697 [Penicillium vulpinum]